MPYLWFTYMYTSPELPKRSWTQLSYSYMYTSPELNNLIHNFTELNKCRTNHTPACISNILIPLEEGPRCLVWIPPLILTFDPLFFLVFGGPTLENAFFPFLILSLCWLCVVDWLLLGSYLSVLSMAPSVLQMIRRRTSEVFGTEEARTLPPCCEPFRNVRPRELRRWKLTSAARNIFSQHQSVQAVVFWSGSWSSVHTKCSYSLLLGHKGDISTT